MNAIFTSRAGRISMVSACCVLLALGAWLLRATHRAPESVVTATAVYGDLERVVLATGTLEPRSLVSVGAQVSGQLRELNVQLGQTVRAGDPIGRIDAEPQTNALKTAEAALADMVAQRAAQQAVVVQTQLAFARQRAMVAGEATSNAEYEAADASLRSAKAQLAALDARIRSGRISVDTARVNLGYTRITAPMDGVVVAIVTKQGQTVNSNQTAPTIVILARLDQMMVKAEVSEADVINIQPGMPVWFTVLGDQRHRYRSTLRAIDPAPESIVTRIDANAASGAAGITPAAIYYNARFDVSNADGRLRPMMTAQVSVVQARRRHVLVVPSTALGPVAEDGAATVRVRDDRGRIAARRVRVGLMAGAQAEILAGLRAGETIIVAEAMQPKPAGTD